jgi:hypothetical protein
MNILINPTAMFKKSNCFSYVAMNGKRGISTPKFITKSERLTYAELGKLLFEDPEPIYFRTKVKV